MLGWDDFVAVIVRELQLDADPDPSANLISDLALDSLDLYVLGCLYWELTGRDLPAELSLTTMTLGFIYDSYLRDAASAKL
jgi:hypothetical protein